MNKYIISIYIPLTIISISILYQTTSGEPMTLNHAKTTNIKDNQAVVTSDIVDRYL